MPPLVIHEKKSAEKRAYLVPMPSAHAAPEAERKEDASLDQRAAGQQPCHHTATATKSLKLQVFCGATVKVTKTNGLTPNKRKTAR